MEDIKISAEHDWIVRSAVQTKLENWQAITDADCDGFKNLKANRDFIIESCQKVLAELDAHKIVAQIFNDRHDAEVQAVIDSANAVIQQIEKGA